MSRQCLQCSDLCNAALATKDRPWLFLIFYMIYWLNNDCSADWNLLTSCLCFVLFWADLLWAMFLQCCVSAPLWPFQARASVQPLLRLSSEPLRHAGPDIVLEGYATSRTSHTAAVSSAALLSPWCNRPGWLGIKHQLTYLAALRNLCSFQRENFTSDHEPFACYSEDGCTGFLSAGFAKPECKYGNTAIWAMDCGDRKLF